MSFYSACAMYVKETLSLTKVEGHQQDILSRLISSSLAVGGDGWHGEGGEEGDHVGEGDDEEALQDPGLAHHPSKSE